MKLFRLAGYVGCALLVLPFPVSAKSQDTACQLPRTAVEPAARKQSVTPDDLLRLRDFGGVGVAIASQPFKLAPDGKLLALQIRQADPVANSYCTAVVLVPTDARRKPFVIDSGGEIVATYSTAYGAAEVPQGLPKSPLFRWSPDGQSLAYTKSFPDHSELWRFDLQDRSIRRLMTTPVDIEALAWSSDGSALLYSSRPGRIEALEKIKNEGRTGYLYDERFRPLYSDRPLIAADVPLVERAIDSAHGKAIPFPSDEGQRLASTTEWPEKAVAYASYHDKVAWSAPLVNAHGSKPTLNVRMNGRVIGCDNAVCTNVHGVWWSGNGRTLVFERRAGVADSRTEFYTWKPGETSPRALLSTADAIFGCELTGNNLFCAEETATKPRSVIAISIGDGTRHRIFDPNPEFSRRLLGIIQRLEWSNAFGISTFGDLVLPPGYRHDHRLPLVIVQYESRGFLRGGTGDEYPIQALAARGFAVLSFNRPPWFALSGAPRTGTEFDQYNNKGFADRRSNLSSIETIIHRLVDAGIVDPERVAITGLSDGAVTATFALANSPLFSAAILSTCCEGPFGFEIAGVALDDHYIKGGYPSTRRGDREFWELDSLSDAPRAKAVPLLIQASSAEYRMALGTYRELRHQGWPIEMYVYPDEGHIKIWPAHRLTIYQRNIEWLTRKIGLPEW
ncbi:MAG: Atxe2 family lasso peptide isopeptidase [Sphingobium sp.]|uniref:Atxe2 family lasso peptide isopeptidase n=1 Tax=Sphingobium sp. TaxID=1912891 RepID=UPI000DAF7EE8|nr:Atxe2 family lasso peptide isopeptidase [Sphingobium sp.]PZU06954.1 MAG: Atxe2 family lasso peptide isopeptidase [Sphingobium sp.]